MDWLVYPIRDIIVWSFETILEPLGDGSLPFGITPNTIFLLMGFFGLFVWLKMQAKYNAEAAANPNQIK